MTLRRRVTLLLLLPSLATAAPRLTSTPAGFLIDGRPARVRALVVPALDRLAGRGAGVEAAIAAVAAEGFNAIVVRPTDGATAWTGGDAAWIAAAGARGLAVARAGEVVLIDTPPAPRGKRKGAKPEPAPLLVLRPGGNELPLFDARRAGGAVGWQPDPSSTVAAPRVVAAPVLAWLAGPGGVAVRSGATEYAAAVVRRSAVLLNDSAADVGFNLKWETVVAGRLIIGSGKGDTIPAGQVLTFPVEFDLPADAVRGLAASAGGTITLTVEAEAARLADLLTYLVLPPRPVRPSRKPPKG